MDWFIAKGWIKRICQEVIAASGGSGSSAMPSVEVLALPDSTEVVACSEKDNAALAKLLNEYNGIGIIRASYDGMNLNFNVVMAAQYGTQIIISVVQEVGLFLQWISSDGGKTWGTRQYFGE